jgi:hypothetical protein
MVFGSCATQHINSSTHAVIFMGDAYSITGSATVHINPQSHSAIYGPVNKTITVGGGLTFSTAFAQASFGGLIAYDSNVTFSSNVATGARAIANQGGIINRIPTSSTFFPGNAPPQIASYGIYALGPQLDDHISRLASNFVVTNNATPAFSGLFAPNGVRDGSQYHFEANLYTTSGAGGIRYDIGGTATATAITYDTVQMDANVLTQQARFNALGGATGGAAANAWVKIVGTINVNAAGTLTVEFSQNASNAAASTLLAGSTFDVRQVN